MPGIRTRENLYKLEYLQLYEEGYPVGDRPKSDMTHIELAGPGAAVAGGADRRVSSKE